ncbi:TIGR03435 family protein [Acidipila sp. EB88]|uniref:TIGR03435 family protein n=1 Tax=Acidipila sp. EB88 TaxID=2305226 RepID=UPI0013157BAA|nr:TIGR03435 family protein [Acidipila sp. EB88]
MAASAQTPASAPLPEVEAATINPTAPDAINSGFHTEDNGHRAFIENLPVARLLTIVYDLQNDQVIAVPKWAQTDRFDIHIVIAGGATPTLAQWKQLTRAILAERFHLKAHDETRELPVYSLTVDKGGLRIKPSIPMKDDLPDDTMTGYGNLQETNVTMANFSKTLGFLLERPVVDDTHLGEQRFDFTLHWSNTMQTASDNAAALPDLRTALHEQAGLRLTATRGNARVLVIDALDRPTPN